MKRRDLLKGAAILPAFAAYADVPAPPVRERLNQGPFDIDQDQGWQTILFTTPSEKPLRNPGLGLVGYTWEEGGPSLAARAGRETLEQHVERLASLPFLDILYIRCDWRNVQKRAGKLDLDPVWALTFDAAKRHGLRVAFRIQLSNTAFQPEQLALPEFLRSKVPLVKIGAQYTEPRYDHPAFQNAFAELNDLLAAQFEGNPLVEWIDLMQYGFWGEGHTSNFPNPFPDYVTAERTSTAMTRRQLETWKKTPLAVNTQPDISNVGNREVVDMAMRAGAWLRSDSIVVEEPIQIEPDHQSAALACRNPRGRLLPPVRCRETRRRRSRRQRARKLHASCLGREGKLLVALDRIGQSGALQRKISPRLRTFARQSGISAASRLGMAAQAARHDGTDRRHFESWSDWRARSALATPGKPGWKAEAARRA